MNDAAVLCDHGAPSAERLLFRFDRMKLTVNGERYEHSGHGTIAELLLDIGAVPERVAVVLNDEIIRAEARATAVLKDGDRVEVIVFAAGG